nr:hypothetical protein [Hymenobacter terrenus]
MDGLGQLRRPVGAMAFGKADYAVLLPGPEPVVDRGVVHGEHGRQLGQRLASVVAQNSQGPLPLAWVQSA